VIDKYMPRAWYRAKGDRYVTCRTEADGWPAGRVRREFEEDMKVDLVMVMGFDEFSDSPKLENKFGTWVRASCTSCGTRYYSVHKGMPEGEDGQPLVKCGAEIDERIMVKAKEFIGDWEGSDPDRDRGKSIFKQWREHLSTKNHRWKKKAHYHLQGTMGSLGNDTPRPHITKSESSTLPRSFGGFLIPIPCCQGACLPTKESVNNQLGCMANILADVFHAVRENRVSVLVPGPGAAKDRRYQVGIDDIQAAAPGGWCTGPRRTSSRGTGRHLMGCIWTTTSS